MLQSTLVIIAFIANLLLAEMYPYSFLLLQLPDVDVEMMCKSACTLRVESPIPDEFFSAPVDLFCLFCALAYSYIYHNYGWTMNG